MEKISPELLKLLACPECKAGLLYKKELNLLICTKCSQEYPIKEGIPILIPKGC